MQKIFVQATENSELIGVLSECLMTVIHGHEFSLLPACFIALGDGCLLVFIISVMQLFNRQKYCMCMCKLS